MPEADATRLAVLIDSDNPTAGLTTELLDEIAGSREDDVGGLDTAVTCLPSSRPGSQAASTVIEATRR